MNLTQRIYLAPIQGLFNYHFRKVLTRHTTGIDKYFTPFIRTNGLDQYEARDLREVTESLDSTVKTIPQVMGHHPELLVSLCRRIQDMGFDEINLNLGCPYPMLTKKNMGAGLLPYPDMVDAMLDSIFSQLTIAFSVKMRLGLKDFAEYEKLVPVLNKYPLHEVIVHPRIAKQMYDGLVDLDAFAACAGQLNVPLVYNGDIKSVNDFDALKERFSGIDTWMIGRGIAANPFLAEEIAKHTGFDTGRFVAFHRDLVEEYATSYTGGEIQTILKMVEHWAYFIQNFPGCEKKLKAIKKSRNLTQLHSATQEIIYSDRS